VFDAQVIDVLRGIFTDVCSDAHATLVEMDGSEKREGTNGIGTCAAESRPITIHQSDHFRSRHIGLSCSARISPATIP
jgi:hypothetical protein